MFRGVTVALATPFKDGQVDKKALERLIEFQIEKGTDVILPCGCTGEAATLSHEEQKDLIKTTIELVKKRVLVMAGTGSNNTKEALELTQYAYEAGADGALLITPYYNKPTQEGLVQHYQTIAEAVPIPIVLYNVPGRTGTLIQPETVARLAQVKNIVAIKEAAGCVDQVSKIISLCDMMVLSGDDALTLPMMAVGAQGVVSVAANVVPAETKQMVSAALEGRWDEARELHYKLLPWAHDLFIETNPLPVKTALAFMGLIEKKFRLPLCAMKDTSEQRIKELVEKIQRTYK